MYNPLHGTVVCCLPRNQPFSSNTQFNILTMFSPVSLQIGDNNDERDGESDAGQIEGEISIPFFLKKKDGISAAELRNREVAISEF